MLNRFPRHTDRFTEAAKDHLENLREISDNKYWFDKDTQAMIRIANKYGFVFDVASPS